jgi:hypothetical protein
MTMIGSSRLRRVAVGGALLACLFSDQSAPARASHAPGSSCQVGRDLIYDGHTWFDFGGRDMEYRIIKNSFPAEFDTTREKARVMLRIFDAERTWTQGINDCHYRRLEGFEARFVADFGTDGSNHTDGESTIDFAPGTQCPPVDDDILACTTVEYRLQGTRTVKAGTMRVPREADIRFSSDYSWHINVGSRTCDADEFEYDLRSLATHEFGHAVGLDDLENEPLNGWQTMYGNFDPCEYHPRELGRSDWIGLRNLYTTPGG